MNGCHTVSEPKIARAQGARTVAEDGRPVVGSLLETRAMPPLVAAEASKKVANEVLDGARRFADCKLDSDAGLNFDAFVAFQPPQLRNSFDAAAFRIWFESADMDADGRLSASEVFLWMLRNAGIKHGDSALLYLFTQHDSSGSGLCAQHQPGRPTLE